PSLADAAVRVLLAGTAAQRDAAAAWARAVAADDARARLLARCALATGDAPAALTALRPWLAGATPDPAAADLALEALLALDVEPAVAATWARWADDLPA